MMITKHPGLEKWPIYLDYNATTPIDPAVVDAMLPYLTTYFGNPSSTHGYGYIAKRAQKVAREQVASLIGCKPGEIVFTGCGSESDGLALRGVALSGQARGKHIITQQTEHPAVLNTCRALERLHGFHVTYLPVDSYGRVNPQDVARAIHEQTTLVTIMHANNETGTLQPIAEIAEIAHRYGALMHTDAAQTAGKIPIHIAELGVDLLTLAGHKIYAPKGIGALFVREGVQLEPLIYGGGQEGGRRSGTENVAYEVALGTATVLADEQLSESRERLQRLRDQLQQRLEGALPEKVHLNGHPTERLPNTLNVSIDGVVGEEVLAAVFGLATSTGSACHADSTEPSAVLLAMGMASERALGAFRLTLGRWSTEEDVERAAQLIVDEVQKRLVC